jgi:SPP1 gp7 family putative phage head morphogenesis protein
MNEDIYDEIDAAMYEDEERQTEILTAGATVAFVTGTIYAINTLGKKHNIITDEIVEIGAPHTFPVSTKVLPDLIEIIKDPAEEYAQTYKEELLRGGRYINKPILGEKDAVTGVRKYLGYNREWTPWFSEANTLQREKMLEIIQIGERQGVWPGMKQLSMDTRIARADWINGVAGGKYFEFPALTGTGYPEGTLADTIHSEIFEGINGIFDNYKSRASTIARTESQNIRKVAANERYKRAGIERVQWLCAKAPCEEICSQFCGQIYNWADVPFGAEKSHPNCLCDLRPIVDVW